MSARTAVKMPKQSGKVYIINTDEHWTILFMPKHNGAPFYFDPGAKKPPAALQKWLLTMGCFRRNTVKVQGSTSYLCGLFIIFVFYHVSRGCAIAKVLKLFSRNAAKNDRLVTRFAYDRFKFDVSSEIKL